MKNNIGADVGSAQNDPRMVLIGLASDQTTSNGKIEAALNAILGMETVPAKRSAGYLSEERAREYCGGIAVGTIWKWRTEMGLKSFKVDGRRLYRPSDLEDFIRANTR